MALRQCLHAAWPYAAVILLQFGYAVNTILAKGALDSGLNVFVFVTYRHAVASLVLVPMSLVFERNVRPRLTRSVVLKVLLLALLEPVADQGLFFTGLRLTSATFAAALCNILPAVAFTLACIFRLERLNLTEIRGIAKLVGTLTSFCGAMAMTLLHGPELVMPWSRNRGKHPPSSPKSYISVTSFEFHSREHNLVGAALIFIACICWSSYIILQAFTLREYPAEMSLATLVCVAGVLQGAIVAITSLHGDFSVWTLSWDMTTLSIIYAGIVCSGLAYYLQGFIMKRQGPVFVTAFCPLSMIIVAVLGYLFLSEAIYIGRVVGAIVIVLGLYLVIWGKLNDDGGVQVHATQLHTINGVDMI